MKFTKSLIVLGYSLVFHFITPAIAQNSPNAQELLAKAEAIRNPVDTYKVTVNLVDMDGGKQKDTRVYESLIKDGNKTRVNFVSPAIEQGKRVLMIDNDMWFFTPKTAKPQRIAPSQKVMGNAMYGDIAKLSFTNNYNASYLRADTYEGKKAHVLSLEAISGKPVTYERIEYWIATDSTRPLKAIYSTKSGKVLRHAYFEKYSNVMGQERPTQLRIESVIEKDRVSILTYSDQEKVQVPDRLFDKEALSRE
jgi:outer membrane lipoprotein-sorting protein